MAVRRKTEAKRQDILEGAARVFQKRGFTDATIDDVAREIGGSKATIYNYFASKDQLLKDVLITGYRPVMAHFRGLLAGEGSARVRLAAFASVYLAAINNEYGVQTLRLMASEVGRSDLGAQIAAEPELDIWRSVEATIAEAIAQREIDDAGAAHLTATFRALIHGGSHFDLVTGRSTSGGDPATESDAAVETLFRAYRLEEK
jgi:AcrR family transcriptional regulator